MVTKQEFIVFATCGSYVRVNPLVLSDNLL